MKLTSRLLLYSAVLSIPLLSGIIYGAWWEIWPFVVLVVGLALVIEVVYKIQNRNR